MTAQDIHRRICVADAHADSLMWNRDLTARSQRGHVDFPRLKEAGVKLQCFTIVTRGFPFIGGFPIFAASRGWGKVAFRGEWASTLWQVEQLQTACRASNQGAAVTQTAHQLEGNLAQGTLSAVLGIEGAHALEGDISRVAQLHAMGVRFMSLTHLSNNALGGSSFPFMGNRPLTPHGRDVLDQMAAVGMSVDVAHASPKTLAGILEHPTARPFSSHTGVQGVAPKWRNLSDDALKAIANKGGVVGIIFAPQYLGGRHIDDVVHHIEHAVNMMGEDGVGFGSDFDGMIPLPRGMRDVLDLPRITDALLQKGWPVGRVEKIAGENFRRFFQETLG